jgi:hypothetical protein
MLITMKNSELIDKLVLIANGDLELVQTAIRESAEAGNDGADLKKVVEYIVAYRKPQPERSRERAVA